VIAEVLTEEQLTAAKRDADAWANEAPEWFRVSRVVDDEGQQDVIGIGVYEQELVALIRVSSPAVGVFEIHLDARRTVSGDALTVVIDAVVTQLIEAGACLIVAWSLRQNRRVAAIVQAVGGCWDGTTRLKGVYRGRALEWRRYVWMKGFNDV